MNEPSFKERVLRRFEKEAERVAVAHPDRVPVLIENVVIDEVNECATAMITGSKVECWGDRGRYR